MALEQNPAFQPEKTDGSSDDTSGSKDDKSTGGSIPEIAANDGSVTETLDTAFHGKPGWAEGENPSGSNRADYYESRSQGKTDSEEELDARKEQEKE